MDHELTLRQSEPTGPNDFGGNYSASDQARQHNGNIYTNNAYHYTLRKRRSDETFQGDQRNERFLKAAAEGQTPRVTYFINHLQVDLDYKDDHGFTALHHASLSGFEDTVEVVLAAGCDVNSDSVQLGAPLHQAARKSRLNVLHKLLAYRANVNAESDVDTRLHVAAYYGHHDIAMVLIEKDGNKPRVICKTSSDLEPISCAALGGAVEVVRLLLGRGASVNASGARKVIEKCIDRSAHPACTTVTVLTHAVLGDCALVTELLLDKGAKMPVSASFRQAITKSCMLQPVEGPLSVSKSCFSESLLQSIEKMTWAVLLCATPQKRDVWSALDSYMIVALISMGPPPGDCAAFMGYPQALQVLIGAGAESEAVAANGLTPLHCAAWQGHVQALQVLLDAEADKEALDGLGQTPLVHAIACGHKEAVVSLITAGASVWLRNDHDTLIVASTEKSDCEEIGQLLKDARARTPDVKRSGNNSGNPQKVQAKKTKNVAAVGEDVDSIDRETSSSTEAEHANGSEGTSTHNLKPEVYRSVP